MSMAKPPSPAEPPVLAYLFTLRRARQLNSSIVARQLDKEPPHQLNSLTHSKPRNSLAGTERAAPGDRTAT